MLFNSYQFIFLFLPVTLVVFIILLRKADAMVAQIWLAAASVFFYAESGAAFLLLLGFSIAWNYSIGWALAHRAARKQATKPLLIIGIVLDLLLLAYFKYGIFIDKNLDSATGISLGLHDITLPVGISFYTFTQIAFLVDAAKGKAEEYDLSRYVLFVTFFPHLIAGPIIHHKEMMPQFRQQRNISSRDVAAGLALFAMGLFKKVAIADWVSPHASAVFDGAARVGTVNSIEAWIAAVAYTLQIYFDFSGYSDMALGLGLMFGIRLPMNFFSPYKSANLTEFWRRWHMSLSRFLRDYIYIPMGGNRHGEPRRYFNLFFTMAVGGFWHGAGWTFLFWGAGHGVLLAINHAWHAVGKRCSWRGRPIVIPHWLGIGITLFCVILLWVPFRAPDFGTTLLLWKRMLLIEPALPSVITQLSPSFVAFASSHGIAFVTDHFLSNSQIPWITAKLLAIFAFALFAPNSNQIMRRYRPAIDEIYWRKSDMRSRIMLRLDIRYAAFISAIIIYSVLYIARPSEFIYFQF